MGDNNCSNPYLQAVIDLVDRTEQIRIERGHAIPRTTVTCVDDILEITRHVYLENAIEPFAVYIKLVVDDQVEFDAKYSGRCGIFLRATDIEEFHIKLIKFSQLTPVMFILYGWVGSIEPHGNYIDLPPEHPIPLYVVRKDSLVKISPKAFGSNFLQAMRDLENALGSISLDDDSDLNDD